MAQVSLSLPVELQRYVDDRVAAEGYADSADFLRDLVRRDQDIYRADVVRVRALVQQGIDSGIVDAEPHDILDEIIAGISKPRG